MSIPLNCPNPLCQRKLGAKDEMAGQQARCSGCGTVLMIPWPVSVVEGSRELAHPEEIPPDGGDLPLLEGLEPVLVRTPVGDPDQPTTARTSRRGDGKLPDESRTPARTLGGYALVIGLIYSVEAFYRLARGEAGAMDVVKLLVGALWLGTGYHAWRGSVTAIRLVLGLSLLSLFGLGWLVLGGAEFPRLDFVGWLGLMIALVMIYTACEALGKAKR
jgi:hypothetical protein